MIFYGAGGHGKVVIEAWISSGGTVTAIYDDDVSVKTILGKTVSGVYQPNAFPNASLVVTVGNNTIREKLARTVTNPFGTVIHPSAIISSSAKIDAGSMIMAGSVVQAEAIIGAHVILNTSCSVDHDCHIGDYVHVAPGAVLCGDVRIGTGTLIGAGAIILPGISIGKWAVVGAGSVVVNNVPDATTVFGVPSRAIKK